MRRDLLSRYALMKTIELHVAVDEGRDDKTFDVVILPDLNEFTQVPIFEDKSWRKFCGHPTNPRRRK